MQKQVLKYQEHIIEYELHRKKIKNVHIRIKPYGTVYVSAPYRTSQQTIESILLEKGEWILQALKHFEGQEKPKEMVYTDGETVKFLGELYTLSILEGKRDLVERVDQQVVLYVKDFASEQKVKQLYEKWLRNQADEIFHDIMNRQLEMLRPVLNQQPLLKIRKMKSRWGTCYSTKNTIQLNLELIKMPLGAVEYVVLHELAHFIHPNHSSAFYQFIATYMPDWKLRKSQLKR